MLLVKGVNGRVALSLELLPPGPRFLLLDQAQPHSLGVPHSLQVLVPKEDLSGT